MAFTTWAAWHVEHFGAAEALPRHHPVTYKWKDRGPGGPTQLGLIAQDVQKVVPEVIRADFKSGMLSVSYVGLLPLVINAVQQEHKIVEEQQAVITKMEARLAALENRNLRVVSSGPAGYFGTLAVVGLVPVGLVLARRRRKASETPNA
jgi:hypothetical protein